MSEMRLAIFSRGFISCKGLHQCWLFADTERGKDFAQQVIRSKAAGNF